MRAKEHATRDRSWVPSKYNQIHSCQLKTSLLGSFCALLNMRDVYFVHVINNCQAISAKALRAARGRMARTPRRRPRKLVMMSPRRIRLQQVKDSPMRSAMKARMTMFQTQYCSTLVTIQGIASLRPGSTASNSMFLQAVSKPFFKSRRVLFLTGRVVSTTNSPAAAINTCKP